MVEFKLEYDNKIINEDNLSKLPEGEYFARSEVLEQGDEQSIEKSKLLNYISNLKGKIEEKNRQLYHKNIAIILETISITGPMEVAR